MVADDADLWQWHSRSVPPARRASPAQPRAPFRDLREGGWARPSSRGSAGSTRARTPRRSRPARTPSSEHARMPIGPRSTGPTRCSGV